MTKDIFHFKQFSIRHDECAMKVGTDGVLLGAWCNVESARSVLDVGTGCGLIAIILAQRNAGCHIDAIEIDEASGRQAEENANKCPWSSRISVHRTSFQQFYDKEKKKYDLIVSNPPYFQNSLTNPNREKSVARHSGSLPMDELVAGIDKLLKENGRFCMIMPVTEALIFIDKAKESGMYCRRITSVLPNPGKPPKRYLMEFLKSEGEIVKTELILELDKRHKYSGEFKKLTGDFYLYFRY